MEQITQSKFATASKPKNSIWFYKGEFLFLGAGGYGIGLVFLPIFIAIHMTRRFRSSNSEWDGYYGEVHCEIKEHELVFWSSKRFKFSRIPDRELLRVPISRLTFCEQSFRDETIVSFRFAQELSFKLELVDNVKTFKLFKSTLEREKGQTETGTGPIIDKPD